MNNYQRIGNWEQERRLGQGSFGEVTLWRNIVSRQRVAVKRCPSLKNNPPEKIQKTKERWLNEERILMKEVQMENIVQPVQVDQEFLTEFNSLNPSGLPVLVMEYCDGGDLRKLLHNIENANGLIEYEVKNVLKSINNAIRYLHDRGITHRDLKPENVVIKKNNGANVYKVTDFGYAKDMTSTNVNSQVGTAGYFAPEVLLSGKYSPTIDYWSMGILAFEVICGCRPFIPHQTIMKWAEKLRNKQSSTIAITEDNAGEFREHKEVFNENRISKTFKLAIEQWLTSALDLSRKRGMQTSASGVPDEVQIKFFDKLDRILNKRILTIFCLNTYKFLSYEMSEETTTQDLLREIEKDTNVPPCDLCLILRPEQKPEQVNRPIELILEQSNEVMLYVVGAEKYIPNLKAIKPYMPETIEDFVINMPKLKVFHLLDLARQVLFFRRNESRHYYTFLSGLKNYAMFLNHDLSTRRNTIENITSQYDQIRGSFISFQFMLTHWKQRLEEKNIAHLYLDVVANWETAETEAQREIGTLLDKCKKIEKSNESSLSRSKEVLEREIFTNQDQDIFKIDTLENYYESLRRELNDEKPSKLCSIEKSNEIMEYIRGTVAIRSKLLECPDLQCIQRTISEIHVECLQLKQLISDTINLINSQSRAIIGLILRCHDELCTILERSAVEKFKKSQEKTQDLDAIMNSLDLDDKQNGGASTINFQLEPDQIASLTGMEISCFGEGSDIKLLTEESEQIRNGLNHLFYDIDTNLSMLGTPEHDLASPP